MSRFCSLFSSSSANSTYISSSSTAVLIDAGASTKQILLSLENHGLDEKSIKAIFVTHEHSDHTKALKVLSGKLGVPVYATRKTLEVLIEKNLVDEKTKLVEIDDSGAIIDDLQVVPFHTPHDSADSVGYNIFLPDERKISTCTDLGIVTDTVFKALDGSDLVLLESNHDLQMLKNGPYVLSLKKRIMSDNGHLPNHLCAEAASKLFQGRTTRFVLGHLSKQNNTPQKAFNETKKAFDLLGAKENIDYTLCVGGDCNEVIRL